MIEDDSIVTSLDGSPVVLNNPFENINNNFSDNINNPIKGIARHPILEDDVVVYSNATILGRITIGKGSVIGASVWVTEDVMPESKLYKTSRD